jgi:hypothetical protein
MLNNECDFDFANLDKVLCNQRGGAMLIEGILVMIQSFSK